MILINIIYMKKKEKKNRKPAVTSNGQGFNINIHVYSMDIHMTMMLSAERVELRICLDT